MSPYPFVFSSPSSLVKWFDTRDKKDNFFRQLLSVFFFLTAA